MKAAEITVSATAKPPQYPSGEVRSVSLDLLQYDESYQRPVKPFHVKRIAEDFDPDLAGVLIVARRQRVGSPLLYCVDGRQRVAAMQKNLIQSWRACIFDSDGPTHEAEVFTAINACRKQLAPKELFFARVAAKVPEALDLQAAIQENGLVISATQNQCAWPYFQAVASLYRYMPTQNGPANIRAAFAFIRKTWSGDNDALRGMVVQGVVEFVRIHGDEADMNSLYEHVKKVPVATLIREASVLPNSHVADSFYVTLVQYYNKRRSRNRLTPSPQKGITEAAA